MPDRRVEDDRRDLSERASTTVQLSAIGVMGVETVLWTVWFTRKGNRKSVTNKDSPRSITSSHLTTEASRPTGHSGSIRSLPMPRKDNANTPASAQAQQDAISEGIENFELPRALVTRIAKSAVRRSAPVLTLHSEKNNST